MPEYTKKLFIVTYNFDNVKAGPAIRFMRYAPLLDEQGVEVTFITLKRDTSSTSSPTGAKVIYIDATSNIELIQKAIALLDKEKQPVNILFLALEYKCHNNYRQALKKGHRLLYVSTMELNLKRGFFLKEWILKRILQRVYRQMDFIVSSSEELKGNLLQLNLNKDKLKVIANGVDTVRFAPLEASKKTELREKLGIPVNSIVLLYVGLFIDRKGILDLFETWKELNSINSSISVHLCLVGQHKESHENSELFNQQWPQVYHELQQMSNVSIFPFAPDVEKYYRAADAFIFYSKLEGMPNVYLEALASGLAIFTTRFNGFSDVYGKSNADFFELCRNKQMDANVIKSVVSNTDQLNASRKLSRQKAEDTFSVSQSIHQYYTLLK